ncbi:MAG: D-tyrosyl-tRNA(Tyr) deacylase [Oscillospiraceae bacterium]|nr:D-tyrosyl-tRNA(Tyr) deacylase [Oscillospiraceae bacterium]
MKIVLQRVTEASVTVDNEIVGQIGDGLLVLFGAGAEDTEADAERLAAKIAKLRIFSDENGKINRSVNDIGGALLVVSQFTLYADCSHGNRPSFTGACPPERANQLYEYFMSECRKYVPVVEHGIFGADMKVRLLNDGPFTVMLE